MQHDVLFFSSHFIDDTLNTRAECVRDSLICRKYMFLAKIFALRSMGIQLVPSPHQVSAVAEWWLLALVIMVYVQTISLTYLL